MSLRYLPEYKDDAIAALALARKEASNLQYTHNTLAIPNITLEWVKKLEQEPALAEKIDAFVSRYGRLQDHIGEKLIPKCAKLIGENQKTLLDNLAFAEKVAWLDDAEAFIDARRLRNLLVHEYMTDPTIFLESIHMADQATIMLLDTVERIAGYLKELEVGD